MKRTPRAGQSNLPVPKTSKGSPGNAKSTLSKGGPTRSAEDIPRRVQLSLGPGGASPGPVSPQRRAISPGTPQRRSILPSPVPGQNGPAGGGVRYITEDLIRKVCKEDGLDTITTLNLTLTKAEAGKKIKYIENLERLKRLQVLILSNNIIEKIEKLDKLLKLKELDLSFNCIVKIEGLENLTTLQILNLTGNLIEHIPIWMGKRLKSLRAFYIGKNRLESLSELAKLKPLPDLTQMGVAENPLAEFNHCRPYLVFHLRTLEVIDGQNVTDRERIAAKDRFEQEELERLEKQLESEEAKYRRLEEDHNRSKQERSHMSATEDDLKKRERLQGSRIEELERELETKNDLLKKKTSELNKACEKHYQLEQELAFHKIDSKFDSLGRGPEHSLDETGDDSGLLGESPYIGRARYKANRVAGETEILGAAPSQAQLHSLPGPVRAEVKMEMNQKLDHEIAVKQDKVAKEKSSTVKMAEDRLKRLTDELAMTENKLKQATKDLKGIGDNAMSEKEEQKQAIRQKMARKMRTVNEMKDSATQIEEEIEKTKTSLHRHKMDMTRLKDQISRMDNNDPNYRRMYAEMVDKEQQINESNQMYTQLQDQLELMLDTIAKETNDIKSLEQKLNEDTLETNESLREELDDIVGGLQTYLAQVQTKAAKKEREFDTLLQQNEGLQSQVRKLESELGLVDQEAASLRELERRYTELEKSLHQSEDARRELEDTVQRSRRQDMNTQDTLENQQLENASLKKALKELEQKAKDPEFIQKHWSQNSSGNSDTQSVFAVPKEGELFHRSSDHVSHSTPTLVANAKDTIKKTSFEIVESIPGIIPHDKLVETIPGYVKKPQPRQTDKQNLEKQLQAEKAKAIEGDRKSKEAQKKDEEVRKLMSQLETLKAQNVALKDRVEQDTQTFQSKILESVPNNELRRRLKDLAQSFKQDKITIEPENDKDVLGKTFKELQGFVHDRMNKSTQDADQTRSRLDKSDMENQSLREQLKRMEQKLNKREEKVKNEKTKFRDEAKANQEEIKRLNDENNRLKNALKEAKKRTKGTKIVHEEDGESVFSRRSSLNSEEKHLFDELQNELMSLKRAMRSKEDDANKRMNTHIKDLKALGLLDAETEAAMLEQNLQDKEESYQREIERLKEHMEMQRERQEARIQVIAADLDQAQQVADFLQRTLDDREHQLHSEVQQSDMNNQMITTQEDELAKLYDILEAQREEIGRLNTMLDTISGQGGSLGTAAADEELWRLRQEVNNLKETLAMQSAYVQTMPPPSRPAGVQASTGTGTQYYLTDHGTAAGPTYRPLLSQYRDQQMSLVPPAPGMNTMGTSYAPPGFARPRSMGVGSAVGPVGGQAGSPNLGPAASGADQREVLTPPGGQPAGRSRPSQSPLKRHADSGADAEGDNHSDRTRSSRHRDRGRQKERRSGRQEQKKERRARSADSEHTGEMEPIHRPSALRPQMASGPINMYSTPEGPVYPVGGYPLEGQAYGLGTGQMGAGQLQAAGLPPQFAPLGGTYTTGYQASPQVSPIRGYAGNQTTVMQPAGAPQPSILKHPGIQQTSGPPGTRPQGYIIPPGYTIPPPPQGVSMGTSVSGYGQSSGYPTGATQTPGYGSTQTPGQAASGMAPGFAPLPTHPHGPSVALGNTPGVQPGGGSAFTAPAQAVAYNSGRVFLPAYPTSPSRPAGRVYYSKGSGGGGGGGGGGGPPYGPGTGYEGWGRERSPDQSVRFLPMEPLAQGTPIAGHSMPRTGAGAALIPSPIRPVARDQSPRRMAQTGTAGGDDTYLFCNVPEHHDLEDYIAELQEKLKKLKARIANEKTVHILEALDLQEAVQDNNDYNLIRRLQGELAERRDELEGLDLAIERQQKNLKNLKSEERRLQFERQSAKEELEFTRDQNAKKKRKTRVYPEEEDSFDERMENSRKKMLKDEIKCLEQTLAKRKAQLREADRLLKECNTDLKCAREEAIETVREYDKATVGLESTVKETSELEKRANLAGVELIKASEKLNAIRREIKDSEGKRGKQERLLRDVTQLISKRDAEFKDLDGRSKATQQNLSRLQTELAAASVKERETVQALRDSEDILAKRRNEIARMRDQIDLQKAELEKVDHAMGKKRTELQFLTESLERKQGEINQLIRDTEAELSANKRDIKEQRDMLRNMEVQKSDLAAQIKSHRQELQKLKDEMGTSEEIMQKLVNSVSKHKSDLKHTFEMQRLEQTELDNLKSQHAQRLAELERTQRELIEEKNALEQLNSDVNKKTVEMERLRSCIERDREDVERLAMEKQSYEDRIATMSREKEMLDESLKTLDAKVTHMRRSQSTMEEKIDSTSRRLDTLEQELVRREREMDELNREKTAIAKDVGNVKNAIIDGKTELKGLKEQLKDGEKTMAHLEQQLRDTSLQRDEAKLEIERLNEGIRQSRITHDDCLRQQRQREEELQDLIRTMDEREIEYQETRKSLNKVRKEVEKEESKLQKLVTTANFELDNIRTDLNTKQTELSHATADIMNLKKEAEKMELDEKKLTECENKIRELKQEIQDRNEEKNELAKALTRSYEELQKLRTESAQEQERLTMERMTLQNTLRDMQDQMEHARKEMQQMQKRSSSQAVELQTLAEEQFNRANKLSDELLRLKSRKSFNQLDATLSDVTNQSAENESHDNVNQSIIEQSNARDSTKTKSHDKGQVPTCQSIPTASQSAATTDRFSEDKENMRSDRSDPVEEVRKSDIALRDKLSKEQETLRLQLQQQMQRHADAMEQARLQSEGTIESLRKKLNTLQDVLVTTADITSPTLRRARSRSAGLVPSPDRQRSPSPIYPPRHSYLSQRPRSRSRSADRITRSLYPERDFLTA